MTWTWRTDSRPEPVAGPFDDQAAAERWLAESWEDLLDEGVTEVSLYESDRPVYGPMSLLPPG